MVRITSNYQKKLPNTSNSFQFKQFTVQQQKTAMKVGTDGVLLGAWATIKAGNILDIGTGTGLIALMLAQRNKTALIDAIELEENAFLQAKENVKNCIWKEKISVYHCDIQLFNPKIKYDLIITNPPFFVNSTKAPNTLRNKARHTDTLSFSTLVDVVKRLLKPDGVFVLILPSLAAQQFVELAEKQYLFLTKQCSIKPNFTKPTKRMMMEFSFRKSVLIFEEIIIETEKRHNYTQEYISLTQDFYLKF